MPVFQAHLAKPMDPDELLTSVVRHIHSRNIALKYERTWVDMRSINFCRVILQTVHSPLSANPRARHPAAPPALSRVRTLGERFLHA